MIWTGPRSPRDHPRARGGDQNEPLLKERMAGPSPRARGRLAVAYDAPVVVGTIPARAGETLAHNSLPTQELASKHLRRFFGLECPKLINHPTARSEEDPPRSRALYPSAPLW